MNMDVNAIKNSSRGRHWFGALTDQFQVVDSGIASLLIADGQLNGKPTRVFCVVNNEQNLYPRARQGEVGLLEGWSLARAVDQVIEADRDRAEKR